MKNDMIWIKKLVIVFEELWWIWNCESLTFFPLNLSFFFKTRTVGSRLCGELQQTKIERCCLEPQSTHESISCCFFGNKHFENHFVKLRWVRSPKANFATSEPWVLMNFFLTQKIYHSEVIYEPVGGDIFDQCVRASQESNSQIFQKLVALSFHLKASIGRTQMCSLLL